MIPDLDPKHSVLSHIVTSEMLVDFARGRTVATRDWIAYAETELMCREFQNRVWFDGGLARFIRSQPTKGLSGQFDIIGQPVKKKGYKAVCLSMCGRFLITLHAPETQIADYAKPETWISFITEEDSDMHRMGIQGVYGSLYDIHLMVRAAINWGFSQLGPIDWDARLKSTTVNYAGVNIG